MEEGLNEFDFEPLCDLYDPESQDYDDGDNFFVQDGLGRFDFEARTLLELLEVETLLLDDDPYGTSNDSPTTSSTSTTTATSTSPAQFPTKRLFVQRFDLTPCLRYAAASYAMSTSLTRPASFGNTFAFASDDYSPAFSSRNLCILSPSIQSLHPTLQKNKPLQISKSLPATPTALTMLNQSIVISATSEGTLALLNASNFSDTVPVVSPAIHSSMIRDIASSRDERFVITTSDDGSVVACDPSRLTDPTCITRRAFLGTPVGSVNVHPFNSSVVSITCDAGAVFTSDLRSGPCEDLVPKVVPGPPGLFDHVWADEYTLVTSWGTGYISKVDMRKAGVICSTKDPHLSELESMEFDPNTSCLATCGVGGITTWDMDYLTPEAVYVPEGMPDKSTKYGCCFLENGTMIISSTDGQIAVMGDV